MTSTEITAIHWRLNQRHRKTGFCAWCGERYIGISEHDFAFLPGHGREHTANRDDYLELCRSCHVTYDAADRWARENLHGR